MLCSVATMASILRGRVLPVVLSRRCTRLNERLETRIAAAGYSLLRRCPLILSASRSIIPSPSSFTSPLSSCGDRRIEAVRHAHSEANAPRRKVKASAATTQAPSSVDATGTGTTDEYEAVIGIETHIQLATDTKVGQESRASAEFRCCVARALNKNKCSNRM